MLTEEGEAGRLTYGRGCLFDYRFHPAGGFNPQRLVRANSNNDYGKSDKSSQALKVVVFARV
jgi:hypothetical protein